MMNIQPVYPDCRQAGGKAGIEPHPACAGQVMQPLLHSLLGVGCPAGMPSALDI